MNDHPSVSAMRVPSLRLSILPISASSPHHIKQSAAFVPERHGRMPKPYSSCVLPKMGNVPISSRFKVSLNLKLDELLP